jgi:DnaJ-domain-containing protein 1
VAFAGKLIGGLLGGMIGGPVGAGIGLSLGHAVADGPAAVRAERLHWQHHGFGPSGPGAWIVPEWTARGLRGVPVRVTLALGDCVVGASVVPEARAERCAVPRFFIPYARIADGRSARTWLTAAGAPRDMARFAVRLPSPGRRLGCSGPARAVMALAGSARAGGRGLAAGARAAIEAAFLGGYDLDSDGRRWLTQWLDLLAAAEERRLAPGRVARRLEPHLDPEGAQRLLAWLARAWRASWPTPEGRRWVSDLASDLGTEVDWGPEDDEDEVQGALAVLGLEPGASLEAVRTRWRTLVQDRHPDRARDAADVAQRNRDLAEINVAYRVLISRSTQAER